MKTPVLTLDPKRSWIAFGLFLWTVVVLGVGAIIGLALAEKGIPFSLESGNERFRAYVRSHITVTPPRQTLWLRDMRTGHESLLMRLEGKDESCDELLWSDDSTRLGVLLTGSRFIVFEPESRRRIFDQDLVGPTDYPGNRCVKNLRFLSSDGVEFELCHRWKAGTIARREVYF
jgi:hypothetical protein